MSGPRLLALVVHLFGTIAFYFAMEFKVLQYVYFLSNAMSLLSFFELPKLAEMVTYKFRDVIEPIEVPDCYVLLLRDLLLCFALERSAESLFKIGRLTHTS